MNGDSTNKLLQAKRAMNLAKTAEEFNEKKAIFDGLWNSADALKIAKAASNFYWNNGHNVSS